MFTNSLFYMIFSGFFLEGLQKKEFHVLYILRKKVLNAVLAQTLKFGITFNHLSLSLCTDIYLHYIKVYVSE